MTYPPPPYGGPIRKKRRYMKRYSPTCEVCGRQYRQLATHLKRQCAINQGLNELRRLAADAQARGLMNASLAGRLIGSLAPEIKARLHCERVHTSVTKEGKMCDTSLWCVPWAVSIAQLVQVDVKYRRWMITTMATKPDFHALVMEDWLPAYQAAERLAGPKAAAQHMTKMVRGG